MEGLHVCSFSFSRTLLSVCVSSVLLVSAFNGVVNGRLMYDGRNNGSRAHQEMIGPQKLLNSTSYYNHGSLTFNVLLYGAKGDGMTDDTQAFQSAWQAACQFESAVLEIPARYSFMIQSTIFSGPCESGLTFQVDGVLLAPDGPDCWATNSSRLQWIVFYRADGLILQGSGLIDGNGQNWWNLTCKPHKGVKGSTLPGPCESPVAIRFFESSNVTLRNLRIRNSPQFHVKFDGCESVHIDNIIISSPALSPNTDGIHISNTRSVGIYNSDISNGDDCISIGSGCSDVDIKNVTCGPSHGISIGGLGNHNSLACVSNITVSDVLIKHSDNGVRIKTWQLQRSQPMGIFVLNVDRFRTYFYAVQGGLGSVSGVTFNNVYVDNVRNPIIIDQFYCFTKGCKNQTEAVYVSDIAYRHIRGTYDVRSPAIHLACSDTVPCTNITLLDVMLLPAVGQMVADPYCWNAYGTLQSLTIPPVACLIDADPHPSIQYNIDGCL